MMRFRGIGFLSELILEFFNEVIRLWQRVMGVFMPVYGAAMSGLKFYRINVSLSSFLDSDIDSGRMVECSRSLRTFPSSFRENAPSGTYLIEPGD